MILSGPEIKQRLNKDIFISDFCDSRLNPNSYNIRLHEKLLIYDDLPLDMKKPNTTREVIIPEIGMMLQPGKLYLGRTVERTETKNLVPMLEGRSSIGRLGLFIHVTAGFGDVGFSGYWTLEMHTIHPIIIYPNVEIGQLYFLTIEGDIVEYKSGKYQNNEGVQPSLLYKDFIK